MTDLDGMVVIVVDTPPNNMSTNIVGPKAADEEHNSAIIRAMNAAISKNSNNQALAAVTAEPRATILPTTSPSLPCGTSRCPRPTITEQRLWNRKDSREREMERPSQSSAIRYLQDKHDEQGEDVTQFNGEDPLRCLSQNGYGRFFVV